MRTETEMLALIRSTAQQDERIRAAWLNGSRANPAAARDALQDYDLVLAVTDLPSLCSLAHWESIFGKIAVSQEPDGSPLFPDDREEGRYAFLMQFTDGVRVDLTLLTTQKAVQSFGTDGQTVLLLDKDQFLPPLPAPNDCEYWIQKPDQRRFSACCNEFYWVMPYAAKGLWRGELLYSLDVLNQCVRPMLLMMMEWKAGILTGFSCSAGKSGKLLPKLLPAADTNALFATYCGADSAQQQKALRQMMKLFGTTARFVADSLGFSFFEQEETGCLKIISLFLEDRLFATEEERAAFVSSACESAIFDSGAPFVSVSSAAKEEDDLKSKPKVPLEIERKFAISGFPALPELSRSILRQGYLSTSPVVRIRSRKMSDGTMSFRICVKGKGGLVRTEIEQEISREKFDALCTLLPVPPVEKEQRTYSLPAGLVLECNSVAQGDYWYAEVEFSSTEAAEKFVPPAFLGEELTGKPGFSMSEYWKKLTKDL